ITLDDNTKEPAKQWDDINLRLNTIDDLPKGAGPIYFLKDFGDTAALMLTVASPRAADSEIELRAQRVASAIEKARAPFPEQRKASRTSVVFSFPFSVPLNVPRRQRDLAFDFL